jgi:hypothetical protein
VIRCVNKLMLHFTAKPDKNHILRWVHAEFDSNHLKRRV